MLIWAVHSVRAKLAPVASSRCLQERLDQESFVGMEIVEESGRRG